MSVRFNNAAVSLNKTPIEIITEYPADFRVKNFETFINYYLFLNKRGVVDRFIFDIINEFFRFFLFWVTPLKKTEI